MGRMYGGNLHPVPFRHQNPVVSADRICKMPLRLRKEGPAGGGVYSGFAGV